MQGRAYKQSIFRSYNTSTFSAKRFDENASAKKGDKKAQWFQILHFYWLFSSDIMPVKVLKE